MVTLKLKFELKSELSLAKITQVLFYIGCTKWSADTSPDMSADIHIEISTYIDNFVSAKLNLSWQVQLN